MSEWWSYRPSDLLLFSARTYYRLFERVNAEAWPAQPLVPLLAALALAAGARGWRGAAPALAVGLALGWGWVAWAYHGARFAAINPAAAYYAGAFGLQAGLLLAAAWRAVGAAPRQQPLAAGWALLALAAAMPAVAGLAGRPGSQAEWPGFAPDPTAIATLGALLLWRPATGAERWLWRALWPIPLLWCVLSGTTLMLLDAPDALLPPAAALAAGLALAASGWRGRRRRR